MKVRNCRPHISATYKEVKLNEKEKNIVLQVLGEFVCVRLLGRLFSGEDFLWGRIFSAATFELKKVEG